MLPIANNLGLDKPAKNRVTEIYDRYRGGAPTKFAEFFASERAGLEVKQPKTLLGTFDLHAVLSHVPFSSSIFVEICPYCAGEKNIDSIKTLVNTGSILPVLTAPYDRYREDFAEFIYARDHINRYELSAFRYIAVCSASKGGLCDHCATNHKRKMMRAVRDKSDLGLTQDLVDDIYSSLHPYVSPDFTLMDDFKESARRGDVASALQIARMARTLESLRTSQAFNAPFVLKSSDAISLPKGTSLEVDEIIGDAAATNSDLDAGLGLRIPVDIPLEAYLEVAHDYRSRMGSVVDRVMGGGEKYQQRQDVQVSLMNLNAEIAKLSKSKRLAFLDGAVQFYAANSVYLNASLTAAAAGLTLGLPGCLAGAAVGGLATIAKKKKWVEGGAATDRALDLAKSQVSPVTDRLIAAYTGSSTLAVSVVSLRRDITQRVDRVRTRRTSKLEAPVPVKRPTRKDGR